MLLRQLGRRVDVPGVRPGVLGHHSGRQRCTAVRARRLEPAGVQRGRVARPGRDRPVHRTRVAALAVDDHGTRQHQPADTGLPHGRQQDRRTQVVAPRVGRGVVEIQAEPHHGGLMAHRVHAVQSLGHGDRIPHVPVQELDPGRQPHGRPGRVDPGQQRVQHPHHGAGLPQDLHDMGSDETGAASDKYPHIAKRYKSSP